MMGYCEHGHETSGFIKYWEIFEWLSDWQLLKKVSAPWSQLMFISSYLFYGPVGNSNYIRL
jgi:hypothetical protein